MKKRKDAQDDRKEKGSSSSSLGHATDMLNMSVCYCFYLQQLLLGEGTQQTDRQLTHSTVCNRFERLIKHFKTQNHRTVLWSRYLKYVSTTATAATASREDLLRLVERCMRDLNEVAVHLFPPFAPSAASSSSSSSSKHQRTTTNSSLIVPFNYLPAKNGNSSSTTVDDSFSSHCYYYYYNYYYANDKIEIECDEDKKANSKSSSSSSSSCDCCYYYHNCVVDLVLKLFFNNTETEENANDKEKLTLIGHLLGGHLMPHNGDLLKRQVTLSVKVNGSRAAMQSLYDHLSIHSCDSEHLWILCIDICLQLNDLPQAILIYQKAFSVCTKANKSTMELRNLSALLFPTHTPTHFSFSSNVSLWPSHHSNHAKP